MTLANPNRGGRVRTAPVLETLLRRRSNVTILVHDLDRTNYHVALQLADKVKLVHNLIVLAPKQSKNDQRLKNCCSHICMVRCELDYKMKWYCCLNESGVDYFGEAVVVACRSAIFNTSLEPHLIFDGTPNGLTRYLENLGVRVHYHENSFLSRIKSAKVTGAFNPEHGRGAYLRLDIPVVDKSNDVVLYTDVDVIFLRDPSHTSKPALLAAAPEYTDYQGRMVPYDKVLNTGVMLINLQSFRLEVPGLIDLAAENNFYFHGDGGFYDQGAMNKYFAGRWDFLPQSMNWRPFVGEAIEPTIIHFHGTKPYELAIIKAPYTRPTAKKLYGKNPLGYAMAVKEFKKYCSKESIAIFKEEFPYAKLLCPHDYLLPA